VPGSMSPKPSTSNAVIRGSRATVGRADGCVGCFAGPEGPGSGRRGPASRVHGTCVSLDNLAARSRASADAKRVRARTWSCPSAQAARTPLDSSPSRPHRLLESPAYLLGAWEAICIACAFGTHLRPMRGEG
jgi:hypothetical protein